MADVVNRQTCEHRRSVNTPDFPEADWLINPDLSDLQDVPIRHRKVVGKEVVEMTQAEKDVADIPRADPVREAVKNKLMKVHQFSEQEASYIVN